MACRINCLHTVATRAAEARLEGEPGREHPEKMSPTAIRARLGHHGWGQSGGMVWQSLESRWQDGMKAGWKQMRAEMKIAPWMSVYNQYPEFAFKAQM